MMNEKEFKIYYDRIKKFFANLETDFWADTKILNGTISPSQKSIPFSSRTEGQFSKADEGMVWGKLWDSAWLHLNDEIPCEWKDKTLALRLNLGGEALIFGNDGMPLYSLTNTSVFQSCYRKEIYRLSEENISSDRIDMWIELAANGLFGDEINPDVPGQKCDIALIRHMKLGIFNEEVWKLRLDMETLMGILNMERPAGDYVFGHPAYPKNNRRITHLVMLINDAIDAYGMNPANADKSRTILAAELKRPAVGSAMTVTAVGHAHIDTGWLWPVRETVRKCARTFASQLSLMEQYPDYVFGASQPQHYAFIKEHYPKLYAKIKERIAEGRWEVQGGMWVEADCNIISGESMVRQLLHGKNFYMDEFGIDVKNLWLPDVFGYSAALPQIIRKSGCDYFLTQKICWNQFNRFPYHAFTWHGIDGSGVLTFFPPEDTYNSLLVPDQLNYGCDNLTENHILYESLTLFGIGNGGGGPKEEHIERGLRCTDLEGSPKVRFGRADDFFKRLSTLKNELPHWHGELYFELHRGTLTTQAKNKLYNRRAEQELVEAEFLTSLLDVWEYPDAELKRLWELLLLNQFHDIIPGSSIKEVYEASTKDYSEIFESLAEIRKSVSERVFMRDDSCLTLVNTLSCNYTRMVELPERWKKFEVLHEGRLLPKQGRFAEITVPPQRMITLTQGHPTEHTGKTDSFHGILENDFIRYEFDGNGQLSSAYDKELKREMLCGKGNVLSLYIDNPNSYDAWDIDVFYENELVENARLLKVEKTEHGTLSQSASFEFSIGNSIIFQTVTLEHNSKRLEFRTKAEWNENKKMLRTAFHTSIKTDDAVFEIQYGHVRRSTRRNTSWDLAQFESAAQRYADISETDCGVALLNDCKYGHKILDGTLDLNLLRSPSWPDSTADRGYHEFTYALLPHSGSFHESTVMKEAAMLNRRIRQIDHYAGAADFPCRLIAGENAGLEVLKKAEKSDEYIVRLVDYSGKGSSATLEFNNAAHIRETNLIERLDSPELPFESKQLKIKLMPFEIKTFKFGKADREYDTDAVEKKPEEAKASLMPSPIQVNETRE